jgi:hypothetical protein
MDEIIQYNEIKKNCIETNLNWNFYGKKLGDTFLGIKKIMRGDKKRLGKFCYFLKILLSNKKIIFPL